MAMGLLRLATLLVVGTNALRVPSAPLGARRLVLIRHGAVAREAHDPPVKPGALYGGNIEVPLSALGEAEASAAAEFVGSNVDAEVRVVFSSPMQRALFGAQAVVDKVGLRVVGGLQVVTSEALRELDRGEWTNRTLQEIKVEWGADAYERAAREGDYGRSVGGEGMDDLRERVIVCRDFILKRLQEDQTAVIVSHLWVTRCLLADALGESDVLRVDVPTASVSVIDYVEGSWPLVVSTCAPEVTLVGFKPPLPDSLAHLGATHQAE